ncbi:MAG TPA: CoA-transferase [Solirubrobacterales bacterium]
MPRFLDADEALATIEDGQTVGILGAGGGLLEPDLLIRALGERFDSTGSPTNLTLVHSTGLGDRRERGMTPLARAGMIDRVVAGHWGQTPAMSRLAEAEEIEAYNLPLGVMTQLHRAAAAGSPGVVTRVGLGTFVDPRFGGGRMNERATEDLVELVELGGEEFLSYRTHPLDVALIRGWEADQSGSISLVGEPMLLDVYALATAAHANGGKVIAQVKRVRPADEPLPPGMVTVPGLFVDIVVEHPGQWQTYAGESNPGFAGTERIVLAGEAPMELSDRKVVARRTAQLLEPGSIGAVGVGMPDGVGRVLAEEGCEDEVTLTVEHGIIGGVTERGAIFGASVNFQAMIPAPDMIDFFHSGGLDFAVLGFAQIDRHGNVNVSKFGGTVMGSGGFIDISQGARKAIFCGTFTAGGLDVAVEDGRLALKAEGRTEKFVADVDQITFSGPESLRQGQVTAVVTERAVFELRPEGLTLIEIAPGVDLERDVIAHMGFTPPLAAEMAEMDPALFRPGPIGLAERWGALAEAG